MKRTSFDERRDIQIADDYSQSQMACMFCRRLAGVDDLNKFGARCFDCYREYCAQGRQYPALSQLDRREMAERAKRALSGGVRPSAGEYRQAMQARREAGEQLTAGQRGFLAAVDAHQGVPA